MATDQDGANAPNRSADFVHRYANHVAFELNSMDVRVVFGTTEKNAPPTQHTAITMTWAEAKILAHYLTGNVMIYEGLEGKVRIPIGALPGPPHKPAEDATPERRAVSEALRKLHDDFIAENS